MKYQWVTTASPDVNILHVSERLYPNPSDLARELIQLHGVAFANVLGGGYECQITKARLASWDAVKPAVIEVFRQRFGEMEEQNDAH